MGKLVSGLFNGTGAANYVCIGFVPDFVKVIAVGDTAGANLEWNRNMRLAAEIEGILDTNGATALAPEVITAGISPYYGGDLMTSTNQTSLANGEGVYLWRDSRDYRASSSALVGAGDAVGGDPIAKFTMDTVANRTGHFNADVVGTYIGAGSKIVIGGREFIITVLTAGNGISADEVTISAPLSSAPAVQAGVIGYISNKFDYAPVPIGKLTPAGFKLSMTTVVNVNDELQMFVAGTYDN